MKWQRIVKDYLSFSRKDRIGVLVLLFLIVFVFFLPHFIPKRKANPPSQADSTWIAEMKKLERRGPDSGNEDNFESRRTNNYYSFRRFDENEDEKPPGPAFPFDPNKLSLEGWKKLGLKDRTITTIQNYLDKGGQFRKPEDLEKIYGLSKKDFERLSPYVRIESSQNQKIYPESNHDSTNHFDSSGNKYSNSNKTERVYQPVEINTSDTTAFIALPGIGSKLASRIISYRDKLGGFYSIDQVAETFALPDSTYQLIKPLLRLEIITLRKINLNTATIDDLKAHPYIRWSLANPIIAYRIQHGAFSKIEDLKKIMAVTEEFYNKIAPYLTVQ